MRKILISLIAIVLTLSVVYCGKKSKPDTRARGPVYAVGMYIPVGNNAPEPEWVDQEAGTVMKDGKKMIWFKGVGISRFKEVARSAAKGKGRGNLAEAIKIVVVQQFAEAWENLGAGEDETMERVRQGLTATKTRMKISGSRALRTYKRQVAKILSLNPNGSPGDMGKSRWEYNVQMGIAYSRFVRYRDGLIAREARKAVKPNSRQAKLLKKAEKELDKLDADDNPKLYKVDKEHVN